MQGNKEKWGVKYYYSPGGEGEKVYFIIREMISERLKLSGPVQLADAWDICKGFFSYQAVGVVFKNVLESMIEKKEAQLVRRWIYWIGPPGNDQTRKFKKISPEEIADRNLAILENSRKNGWPKVVNKKPLVPNWFSKVYKTEMSI